MRHVLGLILETAATLIGHHPQEILSMHLRLGHPTRCGPIYLEKGTNVIKTTWDNKSHCLNVLPVL